MPAKIEPPSKKELERLYHGGKLAQGEIAEIYECSDSLVGNWMRDYGIPTRDVRDAQGAVTLDKGTLYSLYVEQELSSTDIAKLYDGLSDDRVLRLLDRNGIQRRPNTWKCAGWNTGKHLSKEQRELLSHIAKQRTGRKSPRYGARLSSETRRKIANSLKGRFRGPDNPNWKSDKAYRRWREVWYSRFEYKEWRSFVFARDDYTCQLCHKPSNGDIEAHHIKPADTHPELLLDRQNGITLCVDCHRQIKGKESEYEQQFSDIVSQSTPPD